METTDTACGYVETTCGYNVHKAKEISVSFPSCQISLEDPDMFGIYIPEKGLSIMLNIEDVLKVIGEKGETKIEIQVPRSKG
jgi:hypothetical protein